MESSLDLKLDRRSGFATRGSVTFGESRLLHPGEDILVEGAFVSHPAMLQTGIACRYKMLGDGRRAIIAFLVPGDFTCPCFMEGHKADFGISSLTVCEVADMPNLTDRVLAGDNPTLARDLLRLDMIERAIERMWLANIGQCNADKRLAHLLCELHHRMTMAGLADERGFPFPITQADLADALGLSQVHVNRVMQHLKELGLVRTASRFIQFPHPGMLEAFADFDPAYLHLDAAAKARHPQQA